MVESNFKGIYLRKLLEKAILILSFGEQINGLVSI